LIEEVKLIKRMSQIKEKSSGKKKAKKTAASKKK
jgi:hypothetical protein